MQKDFLDFLKKSYSNRKYDINKPQIEKFIDDFFHFLFFLEPKKHCSEKEIEEKFQIFQKKISDILSSVFKNPTEITSHQKTFFSSISEIHQSLLKDAQFILENDPAAQNLEEVIISYPGFYAISIYRFAHQIHTQGIPLIPRIWTELAHSKTGIDIHPGAKIGTSFFIDHGTGIVIGETTKIGHFVKIYQNVTLGALAVSKEIAHTKRHPTIEDEVTIYAGATILGGKTTIGKGSTIGGNVWITESIEPYSLVYYKDKTIVKSKEKFPTPIDFSI